MNRRREIRSGLKLAARWACRDLYPCTSRDPQYARSYASRLWFFSVLSVFFSSYSVIARIPAHLLNQAIHRPVVQRELTNAKGTVAVVDEGSPLAFPRV